MKCEDWGLIDYETSVTCQLAALESVADGGEELLVFCSHPPVVTLGRGTVRSEDLIGWQGSTIEVSRGGRATYHGPNQLVIYPILDLSRKHREFKERDVHSYLRALENATLTLVRELGLLQAEVRTATPAQGVSLTGIWVGSRKIASLGIAVRKWITYHGVALNVTHDPSAFQGIRPCGFSSEIMTSLEEELGRKVDVLPIAKKIYSSLLA